MYLANNTEIVNACPNELEPSMEMDEEFRAEYHVPHIQMHAPEKLRKCSLALNFLSRPFFRFNTNMPNNNSMMMTTEQKPPPLPPKTFSSPEVEPFLQQATYNDQDTITTETLVMSKRIPPNPPDTPPPPLTPLHPLPLLPKNEVQKTPPTPGPKHVSIQIHTPPHAVPEDDWTLSFRDYC